MANAFGGSTVELRLVELIMPQKAADESAEDIKTRIYTELRQLGAEEE